MLLPYMNNERVILYSYFTDILQMYYSISYKVWPKSAPPEQEELDLKCVQILRTFLYKKVVQLPEQWDDEGFR